MTSSAWATTGSPERPSQSEGCPLLPGETTVTITEPHEGDRVSGQTVVAGRATSVAGLANLYVFVDSGMSHKVAFDGERVADFRVPVSLAGFADGRHTLSALACDRLGVGGKDERTVIVAVTAAAQEAPTAHESDEAAAAGEEPLVRPAAIGWHSATPGMIRGFTRQYSSSISGAADARVVAGADAARTARGPSASISVPTFAATCLSLLLAMQAAIVLRRRLRPAGAGLHRRSLTETPAAPPHMCATAILMRPRTRRGAAARAFPCPRVSKTAGVGLATVVMVTHNDGPNARPLLARLLDEPRVGEVVVVASGCSDNTVPAVLEVAAGDSRVSLYVEAERSGKASAFNFGLSQAKMPLVVLVSGDVLPAPGAIGHLLEALEDPKVGMSGGRPVPVNSEATFTGHACHLLWRLHHRLALHIPKLGEMVALRAEAARQLPLTSVDEACLQALVESNGWLCVYVPDAVVFNRGPETPRDFVSQRRRIHCGHLWLRHRYGYTVPSMKPVLLLRELVADQFENHARLRPVRLARTAMTVVMEGRARALARIDFVRGKEQHVWKMVESAKAPAAGSDGRVAGGGESLEKVGATPPVSHQPDRERHLPL
ncbi:MAG: glycosyltransferase [Actinomycetota bacterium]